MGAAVGLQVSLQVASLHPVSTDHPRSYHLLLSNKLYIRWLTSSNQCTSFRTIIIPISGVEKFDSVWFVWVCANPRFTLLWLRLLSTAWMVAVHPTWQGLHSLFQWLSFHIGISDLAIIRKMVPATGHLLQLQSYTPTFGSSFGCLCFLKYWVTVCFYSFIAAVHPRVDRVGILTFPWCCS